MIQLLLPVLMSQAPAIKPPLPPIAVLKNAKKLGLTAEQIKSLEAIQALYAVEFYNARQSLVNKSMSFRAEVQDVLTPEQKAKAKKLKIQ
jgi:hypothetical protein